MVSYGQSEFSSAYRNRRIGSEILQASGPYAITEPDLERILPGIKDVDAELYLSGALSHQKGDLDPHNLRFLSRVAKHIKPRRILEIGTYRGKTTYHLAMHSPSDALIATVDLPLEQRTGREKFYGTDILYFRKKDDIGRLYKGTPAERKIRQIFADSLSAEAQHSVDEWLEGDKIDFAFIDASHDYESVKQNFETLVLPRMIQDGVVVFDDYSRPLTHVGVSHYLLRKAHDEGYVFYWFAPANENTTCVLFLNKPEAKGRD